MNDYKIIIINDYEIIIINALKINKIEQSAAKICRNMNKVQRLGYGVPMIYNVLDI